jgi:hypothetical protein
MIEARFFAVDRALFQLCFSVNLADTRAKYKSGTLPASRLGTLVVPVRTTLRLRKLV